jgi:hypothetical protein
MHPVVRMAAVVMLYVVLVVAGVRNVLGDARSVAIGDSGHEHPLKRTLQGGQIRGWHRLRFGFHVVGYSWRNGKILLFGFPIVQRVGCCVYQDIQGLIASPGVHGHFNRCVNMSCGRFPVVLIADLGSGPTWANGHLWRAVKGEIRAQRGNTISMLLAQESIASDDCDHDECPGTERHAVFFEPLGETAAPIVLFALAIWFFFVGFLLFYKGLPLCRTLAWCALCLFAVALCLSLTVCLAIRAVSASADPYATDSIFQNLASIPNSKNAETKQ